MEVRICYTDPNNFREFFDGIESGLPAALEIGVGTAIGVAVAIATGPAAPIVTAALMGSIAGYVGSFATDEISKNLFNDDKTVGFKQHILRSDDENREVSITILSDGTARINSPSGTSDTVYTCIARTENTSKRTRSVNAKVKGPTFAIRLVGTDKCLDFPTPEQSQQPHLWTCQPGNVNQIFEFVQTEEMKQKQAGLFRLVDSDMCLDTTGTIADGVVPHLWPCEVNNRNQLWDDMYAYGSNSDGMIVAYQTNHVLDNSYGQLVDGNRIWLYQANNNLNSQRWQLVPL